MHKCPQCGQKTLKFTKNDMALYVNVIPDAQNRPNYKTQYTIVKILGNKCFPKYNFNTKGESRELSKREHDYVCQAINAKNTFPARPEQLFKMEDGNTVMKELLDKPTS